MLSVGLRRILFRNPKQVAITNILLPQDNLGINIPDALKGSWIGRDVWPENWRPSRALFLGTDATEAERLQFTTRLFIRPAADMRIDEQFLYLLIHF